MRCSLGSEILTDEKKHLLRTCTANQEGPSPILPPDTRFSTPSLPPLPLFCPEDRRLKAKTQGKES